MTISTEVRAAGPFTGTGAVTAFPFAFKVFTAADVLVTRTVSATSVASILALTTDYSVTLNANQNTNPGGTVSLVSALATGYTLDISSSLPYTQPTDLTNGGGFFPSVITDALDRLTILCQQLAKGGVGSGVGGGLSLAQVQAIVDAAILASGGTGGGGGGGGGLLGVTTQTATIGQQTFNVGYVPGKLLVFVNGVFMRPGDDYSATTGTTVVFGTGLDAGAELIFVGMATTEITTFTASIIASTPAGNLSATNVQAALNELDAEKAPKASPTFTGTPLLTDSPLSGATGHEVVDAAWILAKGYGTGGGGGSSVASGITVTPAGTISSTNVQAALNELDGDITALATANTGNETVTTLGTKIAGATAKSTPVDGDFLGLSDSAASAVLKSISWAQIKAALKTYFDTLYGSLAVLNTWTKAQRGTVVALTVTTNAVAVDLALANNFSLTTQATTGQTLSNPTNAVAGQSGQIAITQNATPSTLAYGSNYKFLDGVTPTVSTTANAKNILSYYVQDSTTIWCSLNKGGVA